jgi:hypothetical protein
MRKKNKGDIDGVGPLGTRIAKEDWITLRGRLLNKFLNKSNLFYRKSILKSVHKNREIDTT